MDVPYLLHVPDGDELWLVDGKQRLLITPRIYDLLSSNGADLPPAYGIEELREQNAKLRELVVEVFKCARRGAACETCKVNNDGYACVYIMRDLGIDVDE